MPFARIVFSLALPVSLAAAPASAQEVITEKALSFDLAHAIAQAALEKCRSDGYHVTVTVLDRDGLVKVAGLKDTEGTIALGGGLPIKAGNEVIGAIGVSGAPGGEKDEACANAGIQKLADKLK
jgi:uncharacterized protein GlcG (DUF336 family)